MKTINHGKMRKKTLISLCLALLLAALWAGSAYAATVTYTYDNLNRLKKVDYGNGATIDYTYDAAGNRIALVSVSPSAGSGADVTPPVGAISINGGAFYVKSASVTLSLLAADNNGTVATMQFSNDNATWSGWEPYAQTKSWALASGDGTKTVYAQFKDSTGNMSPDYSAAITLDSSAPVDGTLTATPQNSAVSLSWSGFSDATSGIKVYKLVYGTLGAPASCAEGTLIYSGSATSYIHVRLSNGTAYSYRLCATDKAGNFSVGAAASATPSAPMGISVPGYTTQGIARSDEGSANNNLDTFTNAPMIDVEYEFGIVLKDPTGNTPQYVRLFMTDRSAPLTTDFYPVDLTCDNNWTYGAYCAYPTILGPAANHKYYFEVKLADGTVMRYPAAGEIAGPVAELLTGYNMAGVPRDVAGANLDGATAFGNSLTYKWNSAGLTTDGNQGGYAPVDSSNPIKPGEGYFTIKASGATTLPELGLYNDILATSYTITLSPGWNMVSNPYGGNVKLSAIQVQKGADAPATWAAATASNWIVNAIYYYKGSDWGNTYNSESAGGNPDATLVPWVGYWVYLNKNDAAYKLIITRP